MLVSKTKPCMSKYERFIQLNCEWLIKSVIVYLMVPYYMDNCIVGLHVILELIHAESPDTHRTHPLFLCLGPDLA